MRSLLAVLDGTPHTGTVVEVAADSNEVAVEGVTYRDTGLLHAHEQHTWVRWFRRTH